jgi:hypothetical protein
MLTIPLTVALLFAALQSPVLQQPDGAAQPQKLEEARDKYGPARQAAVQLNDLAGNIHSEGDARSFVDAVAERLGTSAPSWATGIIRRQIAHAEYEAVSDRSRLIPEQRIVNVWNEYVRELDAPEETLVTLAELHNLRDAMYTGSQFLWKKGGITQQFWTIPNVYAVDANGKVADGCRAVEALKILHDMFNTFQMVRGARERAQRGVLVSDTVKQRQQDGTTRSPAARSELRAVANANPLPAAEMRYVQAHGEGDYHWLMVRLYLELFPVD